MEYSFDSSADLPNKLKPSPEELEVIVSACARSVARDEYKFGIVPNEFIRDISLGVITSFGWVEGEQASDAFFELARILEEYREAQSATDPRRADAAKCLGEEFKREAVINNEARALRRLDES